MSTAQELQQAAPLDDGTLLKPVEADRILSWLRMIFNDAIELAPRGAVGAALCAESHLLDSGRELTDTEIERILNAVWWEGARNSASCNHPRMGDWWVCNFGADEVRTCPDCDMVEQRKRKVTKP